MKFLFALTICFFFLSQSFGQDRVNWTFSYDSTSREVKMTAEIAEGWHLYSQYIDNELGPVPTSFSFNENPDVRLVGQVNEPESIREYDPNFEGDLNFFKDKVVFTQKIKLRKSTDLSGSVSFMVCNDTQCLPPTDQEFIIRIE